MIRFPKRLKKRPAWRPSRAGVIDAQIQDVGRLTLQRALEVRGLEDPVPLHRDLGVDPGKVPLEGDVLQESAKRSALSRTSSSRPTRVASSAFWKE